MEIKKAIIPAAGQGTRLGSIARGAKELVPLVDRPAIDWIIEELRNSGIDDICVVTSPGKLEALSSHLAESHVTFAIQHHPLGLGHAVLAGREFAGEDAFVVVLPDDLFLHDQISSRLCTYTEATGRSSIALTEVPEEIVHKYGVASGEMLDGWYRIDGLVEKPEPGTQPSNLTASGRYVLTSEIWPALESTLPGRGGEIQLTDALAELARAGRLDGIVSRGAHHDLGSPESWLAANIAFGAERYGKAWISAQL